ncbi:MAG: uridine kinase [Propionibacteriaceae bacterium]|nr:uridine kinase [Propionibacteriaceae bacterium]
MAAEAGERTLVLIAGPSGSGKSHLARRRSTARPVAWLGLDEFYRDEDHPGLPRTLGIVDWDDIASWDLNHAVSVIDQLLTRGHAEVPCYDISLSRRTGTRTMDTGQARLILAEGIFAADVFRACQRRGLPVRAIWLDRPRLFNFVRRLMRDLAERRKPPVVLVRRGIALAKAEPALRAAAIRAGFEPVTMRQATALLAALNPASPETAQA